VSHAMGQGAYFCGLDDRAAWRDLQNPASAKPTLVLRIQVFVPLCCIRIYRITLGKRFYLCRPFQPIKSHIHQPSARYQFRGLSFPCPADDFQECRTMPSMCGLTMGACMIPRIVLIYQVAVFLVALGLSVYHVARVTKGPPRRFVHYARKPRLEK
jgi:hypothetical protein